MQPNLQKKLTQGFLQSFTPSIITRTYEKLYSWKAMLILLINKSFTLKIKPIHVSLQREVYTTQFNSQTLTITAIFVKVLLCN